MRIYVQTPDGQTIEFEEVPSDTVEKVKADIKDKEGISLDQQHLFYRGRRLDDPKMLSEYGVHDESTLTLKVGTLMKIFVETQSGETEELEVLPIDTVKSVKEQIF